MAVWVKEVVSWAVRVIVTGLVLGYEVMVLRLVLANDSLCLGKLLVYFD